MEHRIAYTLLSTLSLLTIVLSMTYSSTSFSQLPHESNDYAEIIIGLNNKTENNQGLTTLLTKYDAEIIGNVSLYGQINAVVSRVPSNDLTSDLIGDLRTNSLVEYVEPNVRFKAFQYEPNDPRYQNATEQWAPRKINANWAWNETTGNGSLIVALIDSGINYTHEDLSANYVPLGYDWVHGNNDPRDDEGHGTHTSGIIGATINNGLGIAGLAQVGIMMEKAGDSEGMMTVANMANAIIHATDQGARIISISAGSYLRSDTVYNAIKYAYNKGVLIIASAGNDNFQGRLYPAAFPEVISVSGTDANDYHWHGFDPYGGTYGTNYGDWIELAAPAADILSTAWNPFLLNQYAKESGTSASAPIVAGVAALVWSHFPNMTRDQLRVHLRKTAVDLGDTGFDQWYGYGRIDANASVSQPPPPHDLLVYNWQKPSYVQSGSWYTINATVLNYGSSDESNVQVQLLINGTVQSTQTINSLATGATSVVSFNWMPPVPRDYNVSVYVVPVNGETDVQDNHVSAGVTHEVGVIRVPQQYPTIQEAVDAANPGDTIYVANGTYKEAVNIYKNGLQLVGQNNTFTGIDCCLAPGAWGFAAVNVQNINITDFRIYNTAGTGSTLKESGIIFYSVWNSSITNCLLHDNMGAGAAITLSTWSRYNSITDNKIYHCEYGIRLEWVFSDWNIIKQNFIYENYNYTFVLDHAKMNIIYHNNLENCSITNHLLLSDNISAGPLSNQWHDRWNVSDCFWSDYTGNDNGSNNRTAGDGIGDTNLPWYNVDNYTLMGRWLPGDINHDGRVNGIDLCRVLSGQGKTCNSSDWYPWHAHEDLNEDGIVDSTDEQIVLQNFGMTWQRYWGFPP